MELSRLQLHRMHELLSTGYEMNDFASWIGAPEDEAIELETDVSWFLASRCKWVNAESDPNQEGTSGATKENVMKLTAYCSRHSEICFGARLEIGLGGQWWRWREIAAEKLKRS